MGKSFTDDFLDALFNSSWTWKIFRTNKPSVWHGSEVIEVIEEIPNQKQNVWLLKLNKSVKFNDQIRPVCLPRQKSTISQQLTEVCWVDGSWMNNLKLKITSNGTCDMNTGDYNKNICVQGAEDKRTNFCTRVERGDRDKCNVRSRNIPI